MTSEKTLSDDDIALFRQAVSGAKPIKPDNSVMPERRAPSPVKKSMTVGGSTTALGANSDSITALFHLPPLIDTTDDENVRTVFARQGLDRKQIKRLKKGQYHYQDVLDLHGTRAHLVEKALETFIGESIEHHYSCVLLIYGKGFHSIDGKGVVKPIAISWLKRSSVVVAFCSAISKHGDNGAAYVLLKP